MLTEHTTIPPPPKIRQRIKQGLSARASKTLLPVLQRVGSGYVGGETVEQALTVADHLATRNIDACLGHWDTGLESLSEVGAIYSKAIAALSSARSGTYLSLKPPAMRFDTGLAADLGAMAKLKDVHLHCDSHGIDSCDGTKAVVQTLCSTLGHEKVGTTLPARWSRSLADADWVIETGIGVRVVKGQWPERPDDAHELNSAFLDLIDKLAGRARHVAVATHDPRLGSEAMKRLRAAGTPCQREVIYGVALAPYLSQPLMQAADLRVYIPYGCGYLPSAIGILRNNPRLILRIITNLVTSRTSSRI